MGLGIEENVRLKVFKEASTTHILRPFEFRNEFTVEDESEAQQKLTHAGIENATGLKALLKDIDFTSVTTRQLQAIGVWLGEAELVDPCVTCSFIQGRGDFDIDGRATNLDLSFNAVALFNQSLEGHNDLAITRPIFASDQGFKSTTETLVAANHLLGALAYYASTGREPLSLSEHA